MNRYSVSVVSAKRHIVETDAETSEAASRRAEEIVSEHVLEADYIEAIDVIEITS